MLSGCWLVNPCLGRSYRIVPLPYHRNEAELAIRPYVIWRKTSFFSQLARRDQFRPVILTLTKTCKRRGMGVYGLLRSVCEQDRCGQSRYRTLTIRPARDISLAPVNVYSQRWLWCAWSPHLKTVLAYALSLRQDGILTTLLEKLKDFSCRLYR